MSVRLVLKGSKGIPDLWSVIIDGKEFGVTARNQAHALDKVKRGLGDVVTEAGFVDPADSTARLKLKDAKVPFDDWSAKLIREADATDEPGFWEVTDPDGLTSVVKAEDGVDAIDQAFLGKLAFDPRKSRDPTPEIPPPGHKRMFHGTDKDVEKFDLKFASENEPGIFMTPDQDLAELFGDNIIPLDVDLHNAAVVDMSRHGWEYHSGLVSRAIKMAKKKGKDFLIFKNMSEDLGMWGPFGQDPSPIPDQVVALHPKGRVKNAKTGKVMFATGVPGITFVKPEELEERSIARKLLKSSMEKAALMGLSMIPGGRMVAQNPQVLNSEFSREMLRAFSSGLQLPGDVMEGKVDLQDPASSLGRVVDMLSFLPIGGLAAKPASSLGVLGGSMKSGASVKKTSDIGAELKVDMPYMSDVNVLRYKSEIPSSVEGKEPGRVSVYFFKNRNKPEESTVSFDLWDKEGLQMGAGHGGADFRKILGTVQNAFSDYVERAQPGLIKFQGVDPRLTKFYDVAAPRLARMFGAKAERMSVPGDEPVWSIKWPAKESKMKDITEDIIGTIDKPQGEVKDITEQVMSASPTLRSTSVPMTTPPVIDEPPPGAAKAQTSSWKQAFGRATYQRFIDNFLSTPDLIASQAQRVVLPPVVNAAMDFAGVRPEIPQLKGNILPTGEQVMAGAQVAKSAIQGQPVSFEEAEAAGREVAAAHPTATTAGTLAGDALTLFTGKAPIARFARNARVHNMNVINPEPWKAVAPGTAQLISRVVNSAPIQRLGRGLGRSMEAGIEGAVLSTLNGSDPVETAALAAGGQTAGSMALSILPKSVKGFGVFGGTVVGMWALVRLLQDILPGGETGSAGAALDTVMAKMKWGLIAGGTAALAGAGRIRKNTMADAWPEIAEALTQLPRGAIISAWSEFARDKETGPGFIEPITKEIAENPQNFTPYERDRIVRAMKSDKQSISNTIQDLMKRSPEFTKQVQAIMENVQ